MLKAVLSRACLLVSAPPATLVMFAQPQWFGMQLLSTLMVQLVVAAVLASPTALRCLRFRQGLRHSPLL